MLTTYTKKTTSLFLSALRYQSGFFFQHEAMLPFDYYWRIEPDVEYSCDLDFDPFLFMQDNNKKYGTPYAHKEMAR